MKKIFFTCAALMLLYAAQGQQHQIAVTTAGSVHANIQQLQLSNHEIAASLNKWLKLNSDYSFLKTSASLGLNGMLHETFQQYYKGIPVKGGQIKVHSKSGIVHSINGRILNTTLPQVTPTISADKAKDIAFNSLGLKNVTYQESPQLTIAFNALEKPTLVYNIRMDGRTSQQVLKMSTVQINALTGQVVATIPMLHHTSATGSTFYSGAQNFMTEAVTGGYRLHDTARKIHTYDVAGIVPDMDSAAGIAFTITRDIINATTTWNPIPFLQSTSLAAVGSTGTFFNGLGISFSMAGITGKLLTAAVDRGTGATAENLYKTQILDTAVATILPANAGNLFIPVVDDMVGSYYVDSVALNLSTFQFESLGYVASQYTAFDIDATTPGIYTWSDASKGTSGNYEIISSAHPAIDAHWGITKTYDYYMDKFDHQSYDKAGSPIRNYYNGVFYLAGTNNNAAALPAPYNAMVYGTGDGVDYNPFVTLDITGHEYTHLVINATSNLEYQGESGALNESFADIMGVAIDFYAKSDAANWVLGDSMCITVPYFRSMSDPNAPEAFTSAIARPQPDTYKGRHWLATTSSEDNGGVHINSGVPNYWFYLLAEGDTGVNDNGIAYNVSPIGLAKAEQIAYITFTEYLTESAQFIDAYNASLEVTASLYGDTSVEYNTVKDAWRAVGIPEGMSIENQTALVSKLNVYPNPSTGILYLDNGFSNNVTVDIYNVAGLRVVQGVHLAPGQQSINLAGLPSGTYMLQCYTKEGNFSHKVVLK